MEEIEIVIDTEDIKKYMYEELIKSGFVPKENEVSVIADIVFDYLVKIGIITEQVDFEDFDLDEDDYVD